MLAGGRERDGKAARERDGRGMGGKKDEPGSVQVMYCFQVKCTDPIDRPARPPASNSGKNGTGVIQ
jgi:hypothetical protein